MIDSSIWLITPGALSAYLALGARAARGEAISPPARATRPSQGNVAVLDMVGVLIPGAVPAYARGYATSTTELAQQYRDAAADPNVSAIVLRSDSPGGVVSGTQELSDTIYSLRGAKPAVTLVDGVCCSAALWAGSATGEIIIGSDTAQVGSIGCIVQHVDESAANEKAGYRVTEITSAKYKATGSPNKPLDEIGREQMQRTVDHIHGVFAGQVARNLGMAPSAVAKVADGRVFLGRESITVGLAQGIKPFHSALAAIAGGVTAAKPQHDVAARARLYAIAEQKRTGRHVPAYEAVNHILNGGI